MLYWSFKTFFSQLLKEFLTLFDWKMVLLLFAFANHVFVQDNSSAFVTLEFILAPSAAAASFT